MDKNGMETKGFVFIENVTLTFERSTNAQLHLFSIAISVSVVFCLMGILVLVTCLNRRRTDSEEDDQESFEVEEDSSQMAYDADELSKDGFAKIITDFPNDNLMAMSSVEFGQRFDGNFGFILPKSGGIQLLPSTDNID